ncbi:BglG family transcription antiterminator [Spirochaeta isovalerica]|uniref:Mannitol operon transcriptional antiterminator n=1 Tax=Spirochaeta isovalerica TaxID=150 RepID=A0A841RBH0_9SPIO|nr:helix-turn-helix domain-containing protein [Spirochaeta isovalerica]MBB6480360.1 mannitol operon transcriptional antiterminator [Spirochaeta isovalerica]
MLRLLLLNEGSLLIDDLAGTFSIGRRTVSRDLDVLDKWLSLKGARLERKQNHGIQVLCFGTDPADLIELINKPDSYLESLPPFKRQKLILLYLLFNNREIKISHMANTFFISDTSVWNDLNQIEKSIGDKDIALERMKGVGIRLRGSESYIRMKFLSTMMEVFSSRTIIPHLYSLKESRESTLEINQFNMLMERLRFPVGNSAVQKQIRRAVSALGYSFTMSGEALLYFYLQLTLHRIKAGAMIVRYNSFRCTPLFFNLAQDILSDLLERVFSGAIPEGEIAQLGMILQVLEIGDLKSVRISNFESMIDDEIRDLTARMIERFGELDKQLYYLNHHMEEVLNLSLASLVIRLENGVPYWHGDWGSSSSEEWRRGEKEEYLSSLLKERCGLDPSGRDLEYILILFQSLIISESEVPPRRIRCLVCCFEGIGLASYLQSVLQREIKGINIIEATAVFKIRQEYIDEKGIELIISTFPISDINIPVIDISLPLNKEKIKKEVASLLPLLAPGRDFEPVIAGEEVSFQEVLNLIQNFMMYRLAEAPDIDRVISSLSAELTGTGKKAKKLEKDFRRREDLGTLEFEDYGIRVLHCRSAAVDGPKAGVVDFEADDRARILFMVAPDPCPEQIRKLLSVITISFLENSSFRRSIISGALKDIRKNLMDIFKDVL